MEKNEYILMFFLIFLSFIPVRNIPFVSFAPINIIILIAVAYYVFKINPCMHLNKSTIIVLIVFIVYIFFDTSISIFKNQSYNLFENIRMALFLIIISLFITEINKYKFVFKLILWALFISTFFSICIYFFGEPFSSIRWWIIKGNQIDLPGGTLLGKGQRIAGFTRSIHAFAYQISPAIILAFGMILEEKKKIIWKVMFIVLLFGLILNGERTPLLMTFMGIAGVSIFSNQKRITKLILTCVLVSLVAFTAQFVISLSSYSDSVKTFKEQTLFYRLANANHENDFRSRCLQQFAGAIVILKNPFVGGTNNDYQIEGNKLFNSQNARISAPHNHYINVGMENGIVAIVIILIYAVLFIRITKKYIVCKNNEYRNYYLSAIFSLTAVLFTAFFNNNGLFYGESMTWIIISLVCSGSSIFFERQFEKYDTNETLC